VPEVGGPLDAQNEAHDLVMSAFGGMSKGERNRIKLRVRTAMATQAKIDGRFLGARPPVGGRRLRGRGRCSPVAGKRPLRFIRGGVRSRC